MVDRDTEQALAIPLESVPTIVAAVLGRARNLEHERDAFRAENATLRARVEELEGQIQEKDIEIRGGACHGCKLLRNQLDKVFSVIELVMGGHAPDTDTGIEWLNKLRGRLFAELMTSNDWRKRVGRDYSYEPILEEDIRKLRAELEELRDNHLPKVEGALSRANKIGSACDEEIESLRAELAAAKVDSERLRVLEGLLLDLKIKWSRHELGHICRWEVVVGGVWTHFAELDTAIDAARAGEGVDGE